MSVPPARRRSSLPGSAGFSSAELAIAAPLAQKAGMVTPMRTPEFIYKVASREIYDASLAAGSFVGQPIDLKDGYIHFSSAPQLAETIRLYFAGLNDQVLFQVPCAPFGGALKWQASRGGDLFPHLFATLPMSAVSNMTPLDIPADGVVSLPDWVK
jgi:uncharacterized protein (DUF952 family)